MPKYLDENGLSALWGKITDKVAALKCYDTSASDTAGTWTVTIPGITTLSEGLTIKIRLKTSYNSTTNTLNLNGLGAKTIYWRYGSKLTSHYAKESVLALTYTTDAISSGSDRTGWIIENIYDSTNTYQLRKYYTRYKTQSALYRYMICFINKDEELIPVNNVNNSTATTKTLTTESFMPSKGIYYYNSTTTVEAAKYTGNATLYQQLGLINLQYSFNTGTTLTANKPVYLVVTPQADGQVKLASTPIAQALPTSDTNDWYVFLGTAYDNYRIELPIEHPIYAYHNGYCESLDHTHYNKTILDNTTASFTTTDKTNLETVLNVAAVNTNKITTLDGNVVKLTGDQTVSGVKTFNAPTDVSGTEQTTMKIKTANGGAIIFGKEGPNSGSMIRLDQTDGTTRLQFRASSTAGAMVWKQPESGATLYFDFGPNAVRTTMPTSGGTLAYTSQIPSVGNGTITIRQNGIEVKSFTLNQSSSATVDLTNTTYSAATTTTAGLMSATDKTNLDHLLGKWTDSIYDDIFNNLDNVKSMAHIHSNQTILDNTTASFTTALNTQITNIANGLSNKQNTLVSGTNIKTVNGNSLLGSGNLVISGLPEIGYYSGSASESVNISAPNDEYSMQIGTYGLTVDDGNPADSPDNVFTVNSNTLTWNGYNIPYIVSSSNNYLKLSGSGGTVKLQICKGTIAKSGTSSTRTITLPAAMPSSDYYILLTSASSYQTVLSRVTSKTTTSFTVDNISGGASNGTTVWYYVAIYIAQ